MAFNPQPKRERKEPEKMTSYEFRKKYGSKLKKKNLKPKQGKGSEYSKLVSLADTWFSRFIRLKESNKAGLGGCVSCGKIKEVKYMDCGHYFSRKDKAVRWDEDNCSLQCKMCNKHMGNPVINNDFKSKLISKGVKVEDLNLKRNNVWKPTKFELQLIIDEYREKTNTLLVEKGLEKWW